MTRVIKHFEGSGTSTPYTVPAGKVAQIQGLFTFAATDDTETRRESNFRFGDTTVFMASNRLGGVHWSLSSDTTSLQFFGVSPSSPDFARRTVKLRAGSTTETGPVGSGPVIEFKGAVTYDTGLTNALQIGAPRVYMGAGDSLSFTQGTDTYVGYNFIAIEEDV